MLSQDCGLEDQHKADISFLLAADKSKTNICTFGLSGLNIFKRNGSGSLS